MITFIKWINDILISWEQAYFNRDQDPIPMQQPVTPPVAVNPAPQQTITPVVPSDTIDTLLPWDGPKNNRHNIRVLCDLSGLSLVPSIAVKLPNGTTKLFTAKDIITACIFQESEFMNYFKDGTPVTHDNGSSKDWGIVQINDKYHIGPGKDFPSSDYVMAHPEKAVQFMIDMYKAGKLGMWVSYSSSDFTQWL